MVALLAMSDLYDAPEALEVGSLDEKKLKGQRKFWLRAIWISIAGVIVPPMFGLVGTVVGMFGAFNALGEMGEADPEELAGDISVALLTTMWGLVLSLIALFVLVGVLIRFFKLPKISKES